MSSTEQMRRVIEHSADQLEAALEREHGRNHPDSKQSVAAMAYAVGVMRLLASYLVVTDDTEGGGQS